MSSAGAIRPGFRPQLTAVDGERARPWPAGLVLETRDLRVLFRRGVRSVLAVDGLSYRLFAGKTLAIIGESGSGKSASCRALMGLLPQAAAVMGSVRLNGCELIGLTEREMRRFRGAEIAMVFQDADRALNPTMRVGRQIMEAIGAHERANRLALHRRAVDLLRLLKISAPEQRFFAYPHELSGGMRQRVMIAIAIAARPKVLIADEMARSLDPITQVEIMELLASLQRQLGMALIMISHDLGLAQRFADDVLVTYAGRPVEYAPSGRLFGHPRMPYTKALLDAIPRIDHPCHEPFRVVPGHPPDLDALPTGCVFAPRCPRAAAGCSDLVPPFAEHGGGHRWACWYPL